VHGAGGNVVLFRDLARYLGPDYPFYGMQSHGLDGSTDYLRTVEEMASHYLTEIKKLQPEGPYYLGGFCLGGQVAYEMAQQLKRDDQDVALLVMIDTYNFNGVPLRLSFREGVIQAREKIEFHSANLFGLGLKGQISYLRKKVQGACEREVERIFVRASNLLKLTPLGSGRRKFEVFLEHLNEEAHFAYVPRPYAGRVTIFKPRKNYSHLRDAQMGWGAVIHGGLRIEELPVRPGGLFVEPYVQVLAEKLRACIDEVQSQTKLASVPEASAAQKEIEDYSMRGERGALV
jgi:thioesterase domain-containing protein